MYITLADLEREIERLPLDKDGEVDHGFIESAIERAEKMVDSYLRAAKLDTPATDATILSSIRGPVIDLARYFLEAHHSTDETTKRYEHAVKWLEGVASGKVHLDSADGAQKSRRTGFRTVRIYQA